MSEKSEKSEKPEKSKDSGKEAATRELLLRMAESQPGIQRADSTLTPDETILMEVLLKTGGGAPTPVSKIERVVLHEDFVEICAAESAMLLPYSVVIGLKISPREKSRGAGFLR